VRYTFVAWLFKRLLDEDGQRVFIYGIKHQPDTDARESDEETADIFYA
jgi:hypothetical protein